MKAPQFKKPHLHTASTPSRGRFAPPLAPSSLTPVHKKSTGLMGKQVLTPSNEKQKEQQKKSPAPSRKRVEEKENSSPKKTHNKIPSARRKSQLRAPSPEKSLKSRKKHRFRPGTKALQEIRRFQKSTDTLIPRAPFSRVVAEIFAELGCGHMRIQRLALEALQEASEGYLVFLMDMSNITAIHAKRVTVRPYDMKLVRRIRGEWL